MRLACACVLPSRAGEMHTSEAPSGPRRAGTRTLGCGLPEEGWTKSVGSAGPVGSPPALPKTQERFVESWRSALLMVSTVPPADGPRAGASESGSL